MIRNLLLTLPLFLASCASFLVAKGSAEGDVVFSTDFQKAVVVGVGSGEFSAEMKGSGFPVVVPYEVEDGQVWTWTQNGGVEVYDLTDELPAWLDELFSEDEIAELGLIVAPE